MWLIEDGLAEDDWDGWAALTKRLGELVQLVGDDIFVTNPAIIAEAIGRGVADSTLIKVNQIGTVTETLEAIATCRRGGYAQLVSHRFRRDHRHVHRRPRGQLRLRGAEDRRACSRRAGGQVQAAAEHRRRPARPALWASRAGILKSGDEARWICQSG